MIIYNDTYTPPILLYNGHVHTIYASRFRKSIELPYERERWETPDKDFIDLDFLKDARSKIVIIGHGLEGHSQRPYITNSSELFYTMGWDVCAWNSRSCSGEINIQPRLYSHGDTDDLEFIIERLRQEHNYAKIALLGFSMGGAIIFNMLGKMGSSVPEEICAAVGISTPLDIAAASIELERGFNKYYRDYFMDRLKEKMIIKAGQFPGTIDIKGIEDIKRWKEFDDRFSAPLSGYQDAEEFYYHCSAIHRLENIQVPALLINALDDPLLTDESYTKEPFVNNDTLHAMHTRKGGHVAFLQKGEKYSFAEEKAFEFAEYASKGMKETLYKEFEKL